jgi:hypothetical protein
VTKESGADEVRSGVQADANAPGPSRLAAAALATIWFGSIVVESQVLPRLEGSADPSLLADWPLATRFAVSWLSPQGGSSLVVFIAIGCLAAMCFAYGVSLAFVSRMGGQVNGLPIVVAAAAALYGVAALSPPARNADIFYYAFQGRMIARGSLNPYVEPPRAYNADSWFSFVSPVWRDLTTGYGPSWLVVGDAVDHTTDRGGTTADLARTVLVYRLGFVCANVLSTIMLWIIVGMLAPARRLLSATAFALNPATIMVGVDHNDAVMVALALLGVWLHLRRRPELATVALVLSALVKYYTAPLLVGYLAWQWNARRNNGFLKRSVPLVVAVGTCVLTWLPFNPLVVLSHAPAYLAGSGRLEHLTEIPVLLIVLVAIVLIMLLTRLTEAGSLTDVVRFGTLAFFVYLVFFSRDWFPWYILTAVGLSALIGGWWLEAAAAAGGAWLLVLHGVGPYLAELATRATHVSPSSAVAIALFAPPVTIALAGIARRRLGWPARALWTPGVAGLVAVAVAIQAPLVGHWADPAPTANLLNGRAPGPVVLSTALEWDDWSWGVAVDQTASPPGPDGARSVCVDFGDTSGAFFAHHPGFSTAGYSAIALDLRELSRGAPHLALTARGADGESLGSTALPGPYAAAPAADGWERLQIPLAALNASDTSVTGLLVQNTSSDKQSSVCFQNVTFVPSRAAATTAVN